MLSKFIWVSEHDNYVTTVIGLLETQLDIVSIAEEKTYKHSFYEEMSVWPDINPKMKPCDQLHQINEEEGTYSRTEAETVWILD